MIDTLRLQWEGVHIDEGFYDLLQSEYQTPSYTLRYYDKNLPWRGTQVQDERLGVIGSASNKTGNRLWVERSLPKFLYDDNCRMLSQEEAREGVAGLVAATEAKFGEWLNYDHRTPAGDLIRSGRCKVVCKRVDVYYQRHIPTAGQVFPRIAGSLKNRKVQLHLSGVSIPQSKWEHGRFYDKGLESGNESYTDVVRHEEQLRGPKAGYLVEPRGADIDVQAAREHMNKRFKDWPTTEIENFDLGRLFKEHGASGVAAGLLVLHPEYDPIVRRSLSQSTYYRLRNTALEGQRRMVKLDLRVPGDSWQEPMVL